MKNPSPRRAFTLVELLVVIAIVGVLVGLLLPLLQRVQEQGRKTACLSTIRHISAAVLLYAGDNNMTFPPIENTYTGGDSRWTGFIVPYMGETPGASGTESANFLYTTKIFGCPSDNVVRTSSLKVYQKCSYALNEQVQSPDGDTTIPPLKTGIVTKPVETILLAERWDAGNLTHYPLASSQALVQKDLTPLGKTATGFHSGYSLSNYVMVDGHVETLSSTVTTNLWSFKQ